MTLDFKKFDYLSLVRTVLKEPNLSWFTTVFFNLSSNDNLRIRVILLLNRLGGDLKPGVSNLGGLTSSLSLATLQLLLILDLWYLTWLVSSKVGVITLLTKVLTHNLTGGLNEVLLNKAVFGSLPVTMFLLGLGDLTTSQPVQGSTFWYGVTSPWFLSLFLLLAFLKPAASGRLLSFNLGLDSNVRKGSSDTSLRVDLINPQGSIGNDRAVGITSLNHYFSSGSLQLDENDSLEQFYSTFLQFKEAERLTIPDRGILTKEIEKKGYLLSRNLEPLLNSDLSLLEGRASNVQFLSEICMGYGKLNLTNLSNAELEEVISSCNQVRSRVINQLGSLEMEKSLVEGSKVTVQGTRLTDLLYAAFPKLCSYLVNRVLSYYSKLDGDLTMEEKVRKFCEFMDATYVEMLRTLLLGRSLVRIRTLLSKDYGLEYLPYISENLLFLLLPAKVQEVFNLYEVNYYLQDQESRSEGDPSMLSLQPLKAHVDLDGVCAELRSTLYRLTGDLGLLGSGTLPDGYSWESNELRSAIPIELDLYECLPGKVMINEVEAGTLKDNFGGNLSVILRLLKQDSPFIRFSTKDTLNKVDVSLLDPLTYHILRQQREKGFKANFNELTSLIERLKDVIKGNSSREEGELVPTLIDNEGETYLSPVLNVNLIDSLKPCFKYLTDENLNINASLPGKAEVTLLEQVDSNLSKHHTLTGSSGLRYLCGQGKDVSDEDYMLALKVFGSGNMLTMLSMLFKEFRKEFKEFREKLSYVLKHRQELELRIKKLEKKKKKITDKNEEVISNLRNEVDYKLRNPGQGSLLDVELERRAKMVEPTEQVEPKSKFIKDSELLNEKKTQAERDKLGIKFSISKLVRGRIMKFSLFDLDKKIKKIEDNKREPLSKEIKDRMVKHPKFNRKFDLLREHLGLSLEEFTRLLEFLIDSGSRKSLKECNLFVGKLRDGEMRSREFHSREVYQLYDSEERKDMYDLMGNLLFVFNQKDQHVISRKNGVVTFQLVDSNGDRFNIFVREEGLNQVNLMKNSQPEVLRGDPSLKALISVEGRSTLLEPLFDSRFLHAGSKKDNIVSIGKVKSEVTSLFKFKQLVKNSSTPGWLPSSKRNLLDLEQESLINLVLTGEINKDDLNTLKVLTSQHYSKWFTTSLLQILTGKFTDNHGSKFYIAEGYKGLSIPYFIVSSYNDRSQRNVKTAGGDKDSLGLTISRKEVFRNLDSIGKLLFILLNGGNELRKVVLHHLPDRESRVRLLHDEEFLMKAIKSLELDIKEKEKSDKDEFSLIIEMLTYLKDEKVLRFISTFVNEDEERWVELGNSIQGLLLDIYDKHVSLSQLIDEVNRYNPNQPKNQTFAIARMLGADDIQLSEDLMTVTLPKDNELSFTLGTDLIREVVRTMSSLDIDVSRGQDGSNLENLIMQPNLLENELKARLTNHKGKLIESQETIRKTLRSKDKLIVKVHLSGSKEILPNPSVRCDGKDFLNILFSKL